MLPWLVDTTCLPANGSNIGVNGLHLYQGCPSKTPAKTIFFSRSLTLRNGSISYHWQAPADSNKFESALSTRGKKLAINLPNRTPRPRVGASKIA